MAEYIEREVLIEAFNHANADVLEDYGDGTSRWGFGIENILKVINSIPAADVAPVLHGRCVRFDTDTEQFFLCNKCEKKNTGESNYCHNCGAKMEGESI